MSLRKFNYKLWISWLTIVFLYVAIRINIIDIPLDRDEGIFGYIGQAILDQGLPYHDAFEHKPPIAFYINALALLFVPPTASGIHVFLHVYNFLTLVSLFFLAKIYFRSTHVGLWTALSYAIFSSSPAIQGFTASTEMFMLLPITLSLLFAVLAVRKENLFFALLSGIAGALACWTKQTAVFSVFFAVAYLVAARIFSGREQQNKRLATLVKSLLAWFGGGVSISLFIVAYFTLKGLFDEFIYWGFKHSLLYGQVVDLVDILPRVYFQIKYILKGDFVLVGVGILFGFWSLLREKNDGYFILGFLALSFAGTIPGFAYSHYYAQLAPAVAVGAGVGVSRLVEAVPSVAGRLVVTIFSLVLIVSVPLMAHSGYYLTRSPDEISRSIFSNNPFPESRIVAEFIAQRTEPDDQVFIFGSEAQILFYAQRKSVTSYVLIYPLMSTAYPRHKEFQESTWEDIENNPPKYILVVDLPSSLLWDGKADMSIFHKTLELVNKDYSLEAVMMIGGTKGKLLNASEYENVLDSDRIKANPRIHIYRKKS